VVTCIQGPKKYGQWQKVVFENREWLREGAHGFFNLYIPTPNEVKEASKYEDIT
jgi:hypothetical protein